jgi:hypothetical protein
MVVVVDDWMKKIMICSDYDLSFFVSGRLCGLRKIKAWGTSLAADDFSSVLQSSFCSDF